jgi:hypothetical protein
VTPSPAIDTQSCPARGYSRVPPHFPNLHVHSAKPSSRTPPHAPLPV